MYAQTTGWPPSELMQDDCRELSKWLASKPDARLHAREAAAAISRAMVVEKWPSLDALRVDDPFTEEVR